MFLDGELPSEDQNDLIPDEVASGEGDAVAQEQPLVEDGGLTDEEESAARVWLESDAGRAWLRERDRSRTGHIVSDVQKALRGDKQAYDNLGSDGRRIYQVAAGLTQETRTAYERRLAEQEANALESFAIYNQAAFEFQTGDPAFTEKMRNPDFARFWSEMLAYGQERGWEPGAPFTGAQAGQAVTRPANTRQQAITGASAGAAPADDAWGYFDELRAEEEAKLLRPEDWDALEPEKFGHLTHSQAIRAMSREYSKRVAQAARRVRAPVAAQAESMAQASAAAQRTGGRPLAVGGGRSLERMTHQEIESAFLDAWENSGSENEISPQLRDAYVKSRRSRGLRV